MIACVDVGYVDELGPAIAACVVIVDWADVSSEEERVEIIGRVQPYVPGEFFRRELPCLLKVLRGVEHTLHAIVVDGYVWLDDGGAAPVPGIGAHLHEALDRRVPVIGVAKSPYKDAVGAVPVLRGDSRKPLYVTAVGVDSSEAADCVRRMHGPHRIPTSLRRVDRLSRGDTNGRELGGE